jgi:hypothetical protein
VGWIAVSQALQYVILLLGALLIFAWDVGNFGWPRADKGGNVKGRQVALFIHGWEHFDGLPQLKRRYVS